MNNLTYMDYCNYYANKCVDCNGKKRVLYNKIWTCCPCQHIASVKWKFSQIQIYPQELKCLTWSDFTGEIKSTNKTTGKLEIDGHLAAPAFINAKKKAMEYCFGSSDLKVLENKKEHLIVHDHCKDGNNVVIVGSANTGKTLLASLIIKEVVNASAFFNLSLDFKWIKASDLVDAARWDSNKTINHDFLDSLRYVHFLVIDGVDVPRGGHNTPPDTVALDVLFRGRFLTSYPTIIICTPELYASVLSSRYHGWGSEFVAAMNRKGTVAIELYRD